MYMDLFAYEDYKQYVREWVSGRPKRGRGQYLKIANLLKVHTSMISHIFKGEMDLTAEQAIQLSSFHLGHTELERKYFLTLVLRERAGHFQLKEHYSKELVLIRQQSGELSYRIPHKKVLSDNERGVYYSHWYYSVIRLLCSIKVRARLDLKELLPIDPLVLDQAIEFLIEVGVCEQSGDLISAGQSIVHLESTSPLVSRHHQNFRQLSAQRAFELGEDELMFTAPLTISQEDAHKLRQTIINFIDTVRKTVESTNPEKVMCLNIDWVNVLK